MLDRLPRFTGIPAPALLVLALSACSGPPPAPQVSVPAVTGLAGLLRDEVGAVAMPLPAGAAGLAAMEPFGVAVCLAEEPGRPVAALDDDSRSRLRAWIRGGGRLLLLGYAGRLVYELGLEDRPPDRYGPERWGFDSRTRLGDYRYGFRLVSQRLPELAQDLRAAAGRPYTYLLGGGQGVEMAACLWDAYAPAQGEVLGRLSAVRDGVAEDDRAVVLARWRFGRGQVLCLGTMPEPDCADPVARANARQWLANAVRLLGGGTGRVALWLQPGRLEPRAAVPIGGHVPGLPGAPLLAHWGLLVDLQQLAAGGSVPTASQVLRQALLPAWRRGADLLDVRLPDSGGRYPLVWPRSDPLQRPKDHATAPWIGWDARALRELAVEAHARSILVQSWLAPAPVEDGGAESGPAFLRFLARELLDPRQHGEGAWDGVGLDRGLQDREGRNAALLQDFAPGAFLYSTDPGGTLPATAVGVVPGTAGQPRGIAAAGISDRWRDGFDRHLYPAAMPDCRTRPLAGGVAGSYGDWILTQAHDFVRQRLGRGPALWWRSWDPRAVDGDTLAYVAGISLDPLRCAVAARLWSTGRDGYRAHLAARAEPVQSGFGAESTLPAASPFLQNNHLRLYGSGGSLLWDPRGLARYRDGEAVVLAQEFVRTRLQGARPRSDGLRGERIDLRGTSPRAAGGYPAAVEVDRVAGTGEFPAALALGEAPQWPGRVTVRYAPGPGLFELRVRLRAIRGDGLVELRDDGELLHLLPFRTGARSFDQVLPWHIARSGERTLSLEVIQGGAVAVDELRLVRRGDLAAEVRLGDRAGHRADLEEWTTSSYHADHARWVTVGDFPGLLWRTEYRRADRNLQVRREFGLRHHSELAWHSPGDDSAHLRGPFVLRDPSGRLPELAVVPLRLSRYERFELREGRLAMISQAVPFQHAEVGFCLLTDLPRRAAARLPEVFEAMARPAVLDLDGSGPAELHSELPFAWTRAVMVRNAAASPYLVQENGWWLFRGGQQAKDRADWLRVWHLPGQPVRILTGSAMLAHPRPGPGSLHTVALRDVTPGGLTARVLQADHLAAAPSVLLPEPFDAVRLDGRPWAYHDRRRVFLPAKLGTYRIETATGPAAEPRLLATRALVESCAYDPLRKELIVTTRDSDGRPPELPYTAWFAGPEPVAIEGGERVAEERYPYDQSSAPAAARAGFVVRFRPGVLRLRYAKQDDLQAAPPAGRPVRD